MDGGEKIETQSCYFIFNVKIFLASKKPREIFLLSHEIYFLCKVSLLRYRINYCSTKKLIKGHT